MDLDGPTCRCTDSRSVVRAEIDDVDRASGGNEKLGVVARDDRAFEGLLLVDVFVIQER